MSDSTSPKRRILMVISNLGYGGAEQSFLRLAEYLSRHGEVTIAVMSNRYGNASGYSEVKQQTSVPIIFLSKKISSRIPLFAKALRWWRMAWRLRQLKRSHDVTISFLSGPNLLNVLSGMPHKTMVSERGSKRYGHKMSRFRFWFWVSLVDRFIYRRARWIIAASEGLAGEITMYNPSATHRTRAIEGTIQSEALLKAAAAQSTNEFEALRDYRTIAVIGRLHPIKGFGFLLKCFADVRRTLDDARLLIIGDGPKYSSLLQQTHALDLRIGTAQTSLDPRQCDVLFAGYQKQPLQLLDVATLFALPSRSEGLPNSLIEALASGIPLLAADCPWGSRSVLAHPSDPAPPRVVNTALLLEYGTLLPRIEHENAQRIWAQALTRQLLDPPPRLSHDACRNAIARFDIENTGKQWLECIDAIITADSMPVTKPRILMVISSLGYGGAERSFVRLANYLAESMEVTVCVFRKDYGQAHYSNDHELLNATLIELDEGYHANSKLSSWLHRRRKLRQLKASHDLCISYLSGPNTVNILAGYYHKSIVTLQGSRIYDPVSKGLNQAIFRHLLDPIVYRLAAAIVPVSQGLSNEVRQQAGRKAEARCTVIAPIAPLESLAARMNEPPASAFQALAGQPVIISVGRLSFEKGFQNLIHVMARLNRIMPGVKLLLVGDGPMRTSLEELCKKHKLAVNCFDPGITSVIFTEYQPNPLALIRLSTLYVMSSLTEGLPNVLLESLAAECMIIAADAPWGARAVLQEPSNKKYPPYSAKRETPVEYGVLMPRMDVEAHHELWAQTLAIYLQDSSKREPFIRAGITRVQDFNLDAIGSLWLQLIHTLLK